MVNRIKILLTASKQSFFTRVKKITFKLINVCKDKLLRSLYSLHCINLLGCI